MANTLEQIKQNLIAKASSAGGQLQLDNSIIQSDCYAQVLQAAKVTQIPVQVDKTTPANDIYITGTTLFIKGTATLYNGTVPDFMLQLTGEEATTRTAQFSGTLSSLNITQLNTLGLIATNPSLPSIALPNVTLLGASNPPKGGYATLSVSLQTSTESWPALLPDIGISLTGIGIALTTSAGGSSSLGITGNFLLPNTSSGKQVNITVTIPTSTLATPVWSIGLSAAQGATLINLGDISTLLAGTNVFSQLPPGLSGVGGFGLVALQINFTQSAGSFSIQKIAAQIGCNNWPVGPADKPIFTITSAGVNITVQDPFISASRSISTFIYGNFQIDPTDSTTNLSINMSIPPGNADWVLNAYGEVDLKNVSVFNKLPGGIDAGSLNLPAAVAGNTLALNYFTISFNPSSLQLSYITFSVAVNATWWIIDQSFGIANPMLQVYIPGASLPSPPPLSVSAAGQILLPDDVVLNLAAAYAKGGPWSFNAALAPGSVINVIKLAQKLIGSEVNPDSALGLDTLNITALSMGVVSNPATQQTTYTVSGTTVGNWNTTFGVLPAINAVADFSVTYNGGTSGSIGLTMDVFGISFKVTYAFTTTNTYSLGLEWQGFSFVYDSKSDTITAKGGDWTLGGILTALINEIDPSQDFSLPDPWSLLNSISLKGLELSINLTSKTVSLKYNLSSPIKLFFINITGLSVSVENNSQVNVQLEGSYLDGKPIPKWDAASQSPPAVPGSGSDLFDLKFLALGQHVSLTGLDKVNKVQAALANYEKYLAPPDQGGNTVPVKQTPATPTTGTLVFNANNSWMIAADFTVAKFYQLQFVFDDPDLYGLRIGIANGATYFAGLDFEILYKKITDTIGMYQVILQLPDEFRHIELGEVSITLPNVLVQVYTNGNFYVDFGFPASITDFSRSFSIQVFPFVGYGGFYFGMLSGATSTSVPVTQYGQFNPVIVAGLGLSLGVGKTIEAGILSAGLSLTVVGIFEGVLGFYTCYADSSKTATYYRFSATVGIVGHIYGQVNFAIISAQFDILAYIYATLVIESHRAIPINFQAGVTIRLTVRINLGLFKISISLSFSATISASFSIGTDTWNQALWNNPCVGSGAAALVLADNETYKLVWQPLQYDSGLAAAPAMQLYFIPHLTIGEGAANATAAQYVAMLYIDAPAATATVDNSSLGSLARGVLAWCVNAIVNSGTAHTTYSQLIAQEVTVQQLTALMCVFNNQQDNQAPFNYNNPITNGYDVKGFLQAYFTDGAGTTINISAVAQDTDTTLNAAVFPPMPDLQLQATLNGNTVANADFATTNMTGTQNYIGDVTAILNMLNANYSSNTATVNDAACLSSVDNSGVAIETNLSMATFFFTDFINLVGKQMIRQALDYVNGQQVTSVNIGDLLNNVCTPGNIISLSGMASRFLLHGLRLPTPPVAASGAIEPLYVLTGQQFTIPALQAGKDAFSVTLQKAESTNWISFNKDAKATALPVVISSTEMTRITDTAAATLAAAIQPGYPAPAPVYYDGQQSFTLGSPALWQYPGDYFAGEANQPYILKLPSHLQNELAAYQGAAPVFTVQYLDTTVADPKPVAVNNYVWATTVAVTVQKVTAGNVITSPLQGNMYNLTGADDTGVHFLESLVAYLNSAAGKGFSGQVQLLYQPDPTTNSKGGYVSAASNTTMPPDKVAIAIVQANLSTETNPEQGFMLNKVALGDVVAPSNTLNTFADFVTLLWECSIVRSGGFYLYYNDVAAGNAGLPDALFDGNNSAKLELLITYNSFVAQPFLNSMVIGDAINYNNTSVYAQSASFMLRSSMMLQGNIGYVLKRANPGEYTPPADPDTPPSITEDGIYLGNQFNLLGVSLPANPLYQNLLPSGPVDGDNTQDRQTVTEDGLWHYTGIMPYNSFVAGIANKWNITDPYAGIGTTATLLLNWQDMFGNTLPLPADKEKLNIPVLYTDNIVAVSQWPSASVSYQFAGDGTVNPVCNVSFVFNTGRYAQGDQSSKENAAADVITWARLWFQLSHSADIQMTWTVSVNATAALPAGVVQPVNITQLLQQFVTPVVDYLYAVAQGATPPAAPGSYVLAQTIDPANVTSYQYIFALAAAITISRTQNVDPDFASVAGVASAVTPVQPYMQSAASGDASLLYFAQTFEAAFNNPASSVVYKVATATNVTTASSDPVAAAPVWIVRFDTAGKQGISISYQQDTAHYLAPIPLATSLQNISAPVIGYQTGVPFNPQAQGVTTNFTSIDLDNWCLQLLEAIDKFLSPAYAVPAFLLDNGTSLQKVLDAKQLIAEAIAGMVDYIIEPSDTPDANGFNNAQQKWYQQLLIQLSAAYEYSAAVQRPVSVQSCWGGLNTDPPFEGAAPRLYGKVSGVFEPGEQSSTEQNAVFSAAKLPVAAGDSWLTFMFRIDNSQSQSADFSAVNFEVSHIEWQYEQVEGIDGYLASSWLLLLIPQTLPVTYTSAGEMSIPVPLKAYPFSPYVTGQSGNYPSLVAANTPDPVSVARSWDYVYTYQAPAAAQDTTVMQVQFNVTPPDRSALHNNNAALNLNQALVQFTAMYPQLSSDFDAYLVNVKAAGDGNSAYAANAVNAFVSILNIIGNAWKLSANQVNPFKPSVTKEWVKVKAGTDVLAKVVLKYTVEETENVQLPQPPLIINVTPDKSNTRELVPLVDIAGYDRIASTVGNTTSYTYISQADQTPLLYSNRNVVPGRSATLQSLDVFETQNAVAGLQLKRNLDLLLVKGSTTEWQTTNPLFVYQTPLVMFYSIYQPLFSLDAVINIASIPSSDGTLPQQRSLPDQLLAWANALTVHITDLTSLTVKVECMYEYQMGTSGLMVSIPVLLLPPYTVTIADKGAAFANMLAASMQLWLNAHAPVSVTAQWTFSLQVYSAFGSNLPLLSREFNLPLTAIL
ncbi:hypothetical protein SAMN05421788_10573 [Filimonas lacunae]|uniref:LysM domain-containing protein n=1 Tax=Filimonas lacunae TaxID=477680 RepID=A0A173MD36_9BACT|nr:hypothetical protein [Filimonas lacunae]BAV05475.1 hypothetical protein FLA_1482 [Filimonas lacunae]SIT20889.1 hypothetical protein SAMN05421788_10573 [Filimonas lacunae]